MFFPDGSLEWEVAKVQVEVSAGTFCQAAYHLGGVHFAGTVYCLAYRRHFSSLHPLYDFFKYHCEGTIPHISTAYGPLIGKGGSADRTYSVRRDGFVRLAAEEFDRRYYKQYNLENLIEVSLLFFI